MFNFLFSKSKSNVSAPECDIHIDSIKELNIYVMAVLEGKKSIYINKYADNLFDAEKQGSRSFLGPVYKVKLKTPRGKYDIFYGIHTMDRQGMVMSVTPYLDSICQVLLVELSCKYELFSDYREIVSAQTCYTYYLELMKSTFYITNNSGNDSFSIPFDRTEVITGDRNFVLTLYK